MNYPTALETLQVMSRVYHDAKNEIEKNMPEHPAMPFLNEVIEDLDNTIKSIERMNTFCLNRMMP